VTPDNRVAQGLSGPILDEGRAATSAPESSLHRPGASPETDVDWRTYERLCDEHDTCEDIVNRAFIARFGS
jgi:hypothetical protein